MRNDLLPAVAVNPSTVGYSNTLAALVRRVKGTEEVRERQVAHICFQWNSELTPDEYGADRGHRPAFWVIVSVDTIRRIQDPGAVADYDWLKHYVTSGRGRWVEATSGRRAVPGTSRPPRGADKGRSGSSAASKRGGSTSDFTARYEALKKRSGDVLGVRLRVFLRAFGPPDDKMQAGGVLMGASYNCVDGSIDVAVTEPPNQWVPWIRVRAPDTEKADSSGARANEPGAGSSTSSGTGREGAEGARKEREAEARRKRAAEEKEEERARVEQEEAKRRSERLERFKAALPGVYALSGISASWLGLPGGETARYELVLASDGKAGAALFVQGRARWKASGRWALQESGGDTLRISLVPNGEEDTGSSFVEATAHWSEARPAPLFGAGAGVARPAGIDRLQGRFLGTDKRQVELARVTDVVSTIEGADPELYEQHRRKQAVGRYVPTGATAKTLRAKYRGRVSYRLTLKKDGKFSLYYDIPKAKAVRMSGTWEWDGTTLTLRATKGNGRTLRRAKVDRFSFNGTTIDMDGIILEKD